jgi:gluconokinase
VVAGVAGSGKTTVGRALAQALGWAFHDADDLHPPGNVARMRRGLPLTSAMRAPWLAALRSLLGDLLAAGRPAVLACSALRHEYRQALVPPEAAPDAVRFVFLSVPPSVLEARLRGRTGHFAPAELLESQLATLEAPVEGEEAIVVDGSLPPATIVERVRRALPV